MGACTGNEVTTEQSGTLARGGPAGTLSNPAELVSRDGLLEATLTVAPATIPIAGGSRWAITVNGSSPGPTLRLRPGDHLRLVLQNRTGYSTNLHTHGLRVSPSGNADNPFLEVPAGKTFTYEIDIPSDHPGGLYWYHPHFHHQVAAQLFAGFFGAIILEDSFDDTAGVAGAQERLVLLHDTNPGATESSVMNATGADRMLGREGSLLTVSGQQLPEVSSTTGMLERWRILNASPSRFYRLRLDGHRFNVVGTDGGRLSLPRVVESVDLVPGERLEVFVLPIEAGTFKLSTHPIDRGSPGMGMGGRTNSTSSAPVDLMSFRVTGERAPPAKLPSLPQTRASIDAADSTRELVFAMQGMSFTIDGRTFSGDRVDARVKAGTTEEWTIRNISQMDHPFHLHVWPFQVLAQSQSGSPSPGWKDVVNVPAGGWVRIRIPFTEVTGKTVYHCHILDHEDLGMMGVIEVA